MIFRRCDDGIFLTLRTSLTPLPFHDGDEIPGSLLDLGPHAFAEPAMYCAHVQGPRCEAGVVSETDHTGRAWWIPKLCASHRKLKARAKVRHWVCLIVAQPEPQP